MATTDLIPSQDATLGLIYRLNLLWVKTDYAVLEANYDKWDILLDRLYANLLYREDMVLVENADGSLESVELSSKDKKVYVFLSRKIYEAKKRYLITNNPKNKSVFRSRWYRGVQKKDIWLRKLMHKHNLYIKETAKTPGQALFGNMKMRRK
jgi:hypothetical protein